METTSTTITYQTLSRQPNGDMVIHYHTSSDGLTLPTNSDGNVLQGQDLHDHLQVTPWEDIIPYYSVPDAIQKPLTTEIMYKIENGELLGVKNHHFVDEYNKLHSTNFVANTDYSMPTVDNDLSNVVNPQWTASQEFGFSISSLTDVSPGYIFYSTAKPKPDAIPHPTIPDLVADIYIVACSTGTWLFQSLGNVDSVDGPLLTPQGLVSATHSNNEPLHAIPWTTKNIWKLTALGTEQLDYVCVRPLDGTTFWNRYQLSANQGDTITNDVPSDYAHDSILNSTATSIQYILVLSGNLQDAAGNIYNQFQMIDCSTSTGLTAITPSTLIKIWR